MKSPAFQTQRGFSLVELMVGMAIGLILMSAVVALTVSMLRTNAETVTLSKLTQEGRAISDLVTREVRRARYSGDARAFVGAAAFVNPFGDVEINATKLPTAVTGNCIRFAYDADDDGALEANEVKVISLFNGAVYLGQAATYAGATCVTSSAGAGNALRISSRDVNVTSLEFRGNSTTNGVGGIANRIDLLFTVALANDATVTRRFNQNIQLRNPFL